MFLSFKKFFEGFNHAFNRDTGYYIYIKQNTGKLPDDDDDSEEIDYGKPVTDEKQTRNFNYHFPNVEMATAAFQKYLDTVYYDNGIVHISMTYYDNQSKTDLVWWNYKGGTGTLEFNQRSPEAREIKSRLRKPSMPANFTFTPTTHQTPQKPSLSATSSFAPLSSSDAPTNINRRQ